MTKKFLSILTAVLLLAALMIPAMASATETMYVYTQNGKGLHIRWEPSTNAEILTDAPFGTKITVKNHLGNGWTAIYWGGDDVFYVQTRFLVYNKPSKPTPKPSPAPDPANTGIEDLNRIFRTYRVVSNSYVVTARPTSITGWVNVRFAPSKQAELFATKRDGEQLYVLAELQGWYQVQDPISGYIGYVDANFVVR